MKKKFFSLVLALAMVLPLCPALEIPVFAASGKTGSCKWSISGTTLTISGNGKMADYEFDYYIVDGEIIGSEATTAPWCYYDISEIVIKSGVTHIGDCAFASLCSTSISIPSTVKTVGQSAFLLLVELEDVWYEGTSSDRNKISFDSYDEELTSATWHYNSCMENPSSTNKDHYYSNACDADCNYCGKTRTPSAHTYSTACDTTCNVCGKIRTASAHTYSNVCDATCNNCGATRTAPHSYTNECDTTCNVCGVTRTVTHYTKALTTATPHTLKNDATYPFTTSGDWTVSTNKTKSTTSTYTITAQHACTLKLDYKVSSEAGYDKMTVKKNSATLDTISGEVEKNTT